MAIDHVEVFVASEYDLGIASVEYQWYQWWPASVGKQMFFDVTVNGLGLTPVFGAVTMFVNDQVIATEQLGQIAFGMFESVLFVWTPDTHGDYVIRFELSGNLNDGSGGTYPDENPDNNSIELTFNVPDPELVRFTEGFEHVDWDNPDGATVIFSPSNEWIFTPKWGVTTTLAMRDIISASVYQFNGDEPEVLVTPGMYLPAGDVNIQLIVGGLNNGLTIEGVYLGHSTLEIYLLDAEPNSKDDVKSTLLYTHSLESGDTPTPVSIDATLDTEGTYYIQFQTTSTFNYEGFMSWVFLDNIMVMSYPHTITATAGDNGTIEPAGIVFVKEGTSKNYSITPNTGFIIEDVLVNNESIGAVSNYTFENVTASNTIHATFIADTPDIIYAFSEPFSFNTTPKLSLVSYSGLFSFNTTVYIDTTSIVVYSGLFAFDTRRFTINAVASPVTGGNIGGQGNYVSQQTVSLFAQPNQGYNFVNWTEDGAPVSAEPEYSFIANIDRELIAHFTETTHVDPLADTSIQVFPNPVRNYSMVVAGTVMHYITLSDITGKKMQEIMVMDTQAHIATESLKGGIYFLHIHTEAGTFVRKLQVIK